MNGRPAIPRLLVVGNATLDIINEVTEYPGEDAEVRACARRKCRGGNAANTAVVLAQRGDACAWAGTVADDGEAAIILADLHRHGVATSPAVTVAGGATPTSYVALSRLNGSRTIVHYRDLPEYPAARFRQLDLTPLRWVHFEGRNLQEVAAMMDHLAAGYPALPCSLEVEKPRPGIEQLFPAARLLLFSRVYALHHRFSTPHELLRHWGEELPGIGLVCAWGEEGAFLLEEGEVLHHPAHRPPRVVDTLGAGDVFNAGVIDGVVRGLSLSEAVLRGVRLAGIKCGQEGLDDLDKVELL